MKLITFRTDSGETRVGQLTGDNSVAPLSHADGSPVTKLLDLIVKATSLESLQTNEPELALDSVTLLAPIPEPVRNIFCVGKNYVDHAQEFTKSGFDAGQTAADAIPTHPIVFSKTPQTVIAHGEPIWDAEGISDSVDYEAELAVIIGKGGRGITKESAMEHVWGYTILNDVTARDWQKRHKQWHMAKSFDTFGPLGPVAVTADELDATDLSVKCWVNDELRQDANTKDLIFDIPEIIVTLSAGITLVPGDIIATGTPEGVGIGFNPPRFLKRGDVVAIEISGIGRLENKVGG